MRTILPEELPHRERHQLLLSGVAPRPIALIATVDARGIANLSPYSFYNAYASKPPIVAIGPAISAKTGAEKDTYRNLIDTKEATISACTYAMVEAISLASCEYPSDVDEFVKCGLTKADSQFVRPPRVAEAPFAMECRLMENIELRRDIGGNGNIMLLEVVAFHVADSVLTDGRIDPRKMDLVARMGYDWYARAGRENVFEVPKPTWNGIGVDALPEHIRTSEVLTGNDLAKLAGVRELPMYDGSFPTFDEDFVADRIDIELAARRPDAALYVVMKSPALRHDRRILHTIAQQYLAQHRIDEAWQTLLME
jgi:flavin reductase (DIM6/NTAB) family NADH-FMN oxidoreductase RutF